MGKYPFGSGDVQLIVTNKRVILKESYTFLFMIHSRVEELNLESVHGVNGSIGRGLNKVVFFLGLLLWFTLRGWWKTKDVLYLVLLSILLGTQLQGIMDTNIKMTVVCKMYWFFIGLTLQMIDMNARRHLQHRRVS